MQEVKTRVSCSGFECTAKFEYWGFIEITMKDYSDTFQSRSEPEISITPPDAIEGWTDEGTWTRRYYCPVCSEENREKERKNKWRK